MINFTFDLDSASIEEKTGIIKVPLKSDIPLDYEWWKEITLSIYNHNQTRAPYLQGVKCFISVDRSYTNCENQTFYINLNIEPFNQQDISQEFLDGQKDCFMRIANVANANLEVRRHEKQGQDALIAEAKNKAPDLLKKLKELKG